MWPPSYETKEENYGLRGLGVTKVLKRIFKESDFNIIENFVALIFGKQEQYQLCGTLQITKRIFSK